MDGWEAKFMKEKMKPERSKDRVPLKQAPSMSLLNIERGVALEKKQAQ